MVSILRQIVASPRARHPEAGLDLCYVTDNIIATSGPSATYPQVAYRNPLKDLVKFLDSKHGSSWAIWEFRAEGTGYPDSEVYGRVRHYPWPDHHPPPFKLIPLIMGSMRNWLKDGEGEGEDGRQRVVVVHCKAGKGRSGTVSCSYLISEEGWTAEDAMQRFTARRMRPGFGNGISIPSQRRWIGYVDRWTKGGKLYVERAVEVVEVHVWGLRDGVKIVVEGFVEDGKVIKKFHTFQSSERRLVRGKIRRDAGFADVAMDVMGRKKSSGSVPEQEEARDESDKSPDDKAEATTATKDSDGGLLVDGDVVLSPSTRVVLPSNDINLDFERRNMTRYGGFTMVTSVAHVWLNTFFEGHGPEQDGKADDSGVFEIEWDAMDGIKGSSRKGTRAFDKMAVVWKAVNMEGGNEDQNVLIKEPSPGEDVQQTLPADWRGAEDQTPPNLGLRPDTTESNNVSRASSVVSKPGYQQPAHGSEEELNGVRSSGPDGREELNAVPLSSEEIAPQAAETAKSSVGVPTAVQKKEEAEDQNPTQMDGVAGVSSGPQHIRPEDLPNGRPKDELKDHHDHSVGNVKIKMHPHTSS